MQKAQEHVIRRHARNRQPLPDQPLKLVRPKPLQAPPPSATWFMALPTLIMALMTAFITYVSTGKVGLTVLPMFVTGGMTMGIQLYIARTQRKKVEADNNRSNQNFNNHLESVKKDLAISAQTQFKILHQEQPSINDLAVRVQKRHTTLWERHPSDDDFLSVRLGKGNQALSRPVQLLETDDDDPRLGEANKKIQAFLIVQNLPIVANLNKLSAIGLRGQRPTDTAYLTNSILINVATLHSPDEVHIFVISHRERAHEMWGWVKWLPHSHSLHADKENPHLSFSPTTDDLVLDYLSKELRRRRESIQQNRRMQVTGAHLVIVLDHAPKLQGHQIVQLVLNQRPDEVESRLAATILFVENPIPAQVKGMIEVKSNQVSFRETWMSTANQIRSVGEVEVTTSQMAEQIARHMSPLRTLEGFAASGNGLPSSVRLVEVLGFRKVDDIDLSKWYKARYDRRKMLLFPIGINVDNKPQTVVLRETGQKGNGQHAILAGGTGKGKSITLQSVVLSLAVTHSPHYLNFILADFKGGASELKKLEPLPHVVGFVTDLKPIYVERFRLALEGEILRRKQIFDDTKEKFGQQITNIYDYNDLCLSKGLPYLPHLVLVIDEFHRARALSENFQKTMDSGVAAQGRALGMHLLLSTQKADDFGSVLPNIEVKMSMGMNRAEDSKAIFKRDEAFTMLKRPGQAYLQALQNELEIFEMFQVARSDTDYVKEEEEAVSTRDNFTIARVAMDGRRHVFYEQHQEDKEALAQQAAIKKAVPTEAEKLVEHICNYWDSHQYAAMPPVCLEPLPPAEDLLLSDLLCVTHTFRQWQDECWSTAAVVDQRLKIPLGKLDLPEQQKQIVYQLDMNLGDGNLLLIGPQGAGKTILLRTLLLGLTLTHTPEELQFYCMVRGQSLGVFEEFPHCGGIVRSASERERFGRVIDFILNQMHDRRQLLNIAKVDTLTQLREQQPSHSLPSLFVVIEDIGRVQKEYEDKWDDLLKLVAEARVFDVHVILTNTSMQGLSKIAEHLNTRVALGLKSVADYVEVFNRQSVEVDDIPGRGYVLYEGVPREFQTAAPALINVISVGDAVVGKMLRQLGQKMRQAWTGTTPIIVESLPSLIALEKLWQETPVEPSLPHHLQTAPLGLDYKTLRPVCMDVSLMDPVTLVIGPKGSGKTEWILTFCLAAAYGMSPEVIKLGIVCLDPQSPLIALKELPHVTYIGTKQQMKDKKDIEGIKTNVKQHLDNYNKRQEERPRELTTQFLRELVVEQHTVLIVDGWQQAIKADPDFNTHLKELWDNELCRVVLVDNSAGFSQIFQQYYDVKATVQRYGSHVLLVSDDAVFNLLGNNNRVSGQLKRLFSNQIGKGRAYFSYNNEINVVQFAIAHGADIDMKGRYTQLKEMVKTIQQVQPQA